MIRFTIYHTYTHYTTDTTHTTHTHTHTHTHTLHTLRTTLQYMNKNYLLISYCQNRIEQWYKKSSNNSHISEKSGPADITCV